MRICKYTKCTGCGVCADACPKGCITFKHDKDGFYRSYVDESVCVNCGRCKDVCPANHPYQPNPIKKAYKARRTDQAAAEKSTSGGIAAAISEHVIQSGGAVVGCGYDDKMLLKHSVATNREALEAFKGSKYLQSYTAGIYRQVREQLKTGKPVLFIGSPCQVSALCKYLGREYDNLYTVDFVCHGVPSQYVFDKFLDSLDPTTRPLAVRFRNKSQGYRNIKACFEIEVGYPDRTVRNTAEAGVYGWFASSLSVRGSCYACPFVSLRRPSDITLADYIGKDMNDEDNRVGVSTVFVNSDKGVALMEAIRSEIVAESRDVASTAERYNRLIIRSPRPACRKRFFEDLPTHDYVSLVEAYSGEAILPPKMLRRYYAMKRRFRRLLVRSGRVKG